MMLMLMAVAVLAGDLTLSVQVGWTAVGTAA